VPGIISHCRYPLHAGPVEGINNKIKVLKRMVYCYRDTPASSSRSAQHFPVFREEPFLLDLI
jgi:transposase